MSRGNYTRLVLSLAVIFAVVALCAVLDVTQALAAEDGHEGPRWGDLGWRVLNIVLFVGILWHFIGDLAKKYFRGRRQTIADTLEDLEDRRVRAEKELSAVGARIAGLNEECEAIVAEGRQQAEELRASIIADANRQAEQIVTQAKVTAENEGRAILAEVRAVIADEIIDATEKALAKNLNAAGHEKLIVNSLNKVVLH